MANERGKRRIALALVSLVISAKAVAQPQDLQAPVRFDVASVKPNQSVEAGGNLRRQPGGRVTAVNMPLRTLISFAYGTNPFTLTGGPAWIEQERFDIAAKLEGDAPPFPPASGPDPIMLAMRTLLADRFKLKVHRETRAIDVYALVMARTGGNPGASLKRSTQDCSPEAVRALTTVAPSAPPMPPAARTLPRCGARMSPGRLQLGGLSLASVLGPLGGLAGRMVVDRTGLNGAWDFELTFAPEAGRGLPAGNIPPPDPDAPSIFAALQEQLGLKLEPAKAPIEIVVIDRVEQPTPD